MLKLWNSGQKNGEAKKSTPLLLLCMSCDGSGLDQLLRTAAPVAYIRIAAVGAKLKTKPVIHLTS